MNGQPSEVLLQQFALIGQAMASPHRLKLLQLLFQSEKSVETLAGQTGQSMASTSAHLKVLREACLVESRRQGRFIYYRPASPQVMEFWLALRSLGEQLLPEAREVVRAYFKDPDSLVQLSPDEVLEAVRKGKVILLDVRPADEYAAGHLPEARSMPLEELEQHLKALPKSKQILVYCRGPYCVTAMNAVERLRERGHRASRLPLGVAEWQAEGKALEKSA